MNTSNNNIKRLPFLAWLSNPVRDFYWKSSPAARKAICHLGLVLLLSDVICGFIMASAVCMFVPDLKSDNSMVFLLVFLLSCLLYYVIDRNVVFCSGKSWVSSSTRFAIAFGFALFNSAIVNYYVFRADIEAVRQKEIQIRAGNIRSDYDLKNSVLYEEYQNLLLKEESINDSIGVLRAKLNAELKGFYSGKEGVGPVWQKIKNEFEDAKVRADNQIALIGAEKAALKKRIDDNNNQMNEDINNLQIQSSQGINESMQLLHEIVWVKGSFSNKKTYLIIMMLAMLLELIPILLKRFFNFNLRTYFALEANEEEVYLAQFANDGEIRKAQISSNKTIEMTKIDANTGVEMSLIPLRAEADRKIAQQEGSYKFSEIWVTNNNEHHKFLFEKAIADRDNICETFRKAEKRFPNDENNKSFLDACNTSINKAVKQALKHAAIF